MAWRRSKTGQIIWYINRTYRVLPTREYSKWVAARNQFAILYPERFNK